MAGLSTCDIEIANHGREAWQRPLWCGHCGLRTEASLCAGAHIFLVIRLVGMFLEANFIDTSRFSPRRHDDAVLGHACRHAQVPLIPKSERK